MYFIRLPPACTSESGAETGGTTTTETTITSPNYPSNYDNNIEQTWALTVPDNAVVVIRIDDFYLESGFAHSYGSMYPPECPYDFIRVSKIIYVKSAKVIFFASALNL